jgi:hypothetical protein
VGQIQKATGQMSKVTGLFVPCRVSGAKWVLVGESPKTYLVPLRFFQKFWAKTKMTLMIFYDYFKYLKNHLGPPLCFCPENDQNPDYFTDYNVI